MRYNFTSSSKLIIILLLSLASTGALQAQSITVSGTVYDNSTSEPLPGVTILEQGTTTGTVSDIDGNYRLSVSGPETTLVFSFIGYETQEIAVSGQTVINVSLETSLTQLNEVVVIGYGTVRKSDLTGAVTSIKSEELIKAPAADPIQSLQGKVAGLQILSGSGQPGSGSYVRLRGINTLNNNDVLYVVDGVIMDGGINFLNSQDIESIEVLKDASSKAIFGTRGANGVIIVTTKKAKAGETRFNAAAEYSLESVANTIDLMSGREFASYINAVTPGTYNNLDVLPNTDWQDLVFEENQPIQSYTLSASGATDKMSFYFSGGYFSHKGVIPKSDYERITMKLNTSYEVKEFLTFGANLTGVTSNNQNPPGVLSALYWGWPIDVPYNPDGSFAEVRGGGNPLASIAYSNSFSKRLGILGNIYGELELLKNFTFRTSYQFDLGNNKNRSYSPQFFVSPTQQNEESDISLRMEERRRWIFENTLSYNKTFDSHRIDAVIGYSAQQDDFEFLFGSRENLLGQSEDLWYLDAGAADNQQNSNNASASSIVSLLARVNYVFNDKYLATLTFRRDGSSKFGKNNSHANFPAFALGWNISDEDFYPADFLINNLKLRASWGVNGNEKISYLDQYSRIASGIDAVFGYDEILTPGATFSGNPGNPDLKWEQTTEYDIGIEFHAFESRLTGEIDYYTRTSDQILVYLDLPGYEGAGAFVQKRFNAADVRNRGFDFLLNWQDERGDFTYGIGFNGNLNQNEVLDLGADIGASDEIVNGDLGNGQRVTLTEVGQPIGYFYGYKVIGVFQNTTQLNEYPRLSQQGVGDFIYADTDKNGILNADDRTMIGSWIPDFVYGFNFNVGYKGLGLALDFAGQSGSQIYNGKKALRHSTLNFEDDFLNYWTPENQSNTHPRAALSGINYQPSDFFVEDASFLKLRTVTLSYGIPANILSAANLQTASVFLRGSNLWMSTDYSGYTPEIGTTETAIGGAIDMGIYPTTKVYSIGLNINF